MQSQKNLFDLLRNIAQYDSLLKCNTIQEANFYLINKKKSKDIIFDSQQVVECYIVSHKIAEQIQKNNSSLQTQKDIFMNFKSLVAIVAVLKFSKSLSDDNISILDNVSMHLFVEQLRILKETGQKIGIHYQIKTIFKHLNDIFKQSNITYQNVNIDVFANDLYILNQIKEIKNQCIKALNSHIGENHYISEVSTNNPSMHVSHINLNHSEENSSQQEDLDHSENSSQQDNSWKELYNTIKDCNDHNQSK